MNINVARKWCKLHAFFYYLGLNTIQSILFNIKICFIIFHYAHMSVSVYDKGLWISDFPEQKSLCLGSISHGSWEQNSCPSISIM